MGYIGNEPTTGHFPVDNFTSSGGSTYTLSKAPASAGAIEVSVQGVLQPTTAYTVSGTTLNMAGVTSGVKIFVRHLGETLSIPTPADGSVTTAKLGTNSVDGTKIAMGSDARGDILYHGASDYARLAKGTSGQVLTMGANDPAWANAATSNAGNKGALVDLSADQTGVVTGTFTKVEWDTEVYDVGGNMDIASTYRFVVPSGGDGKYLISGFIAFSSLSAGELGRTRIYKNGSAIYGCNNSQSETSRQGATVTVVLELAATDYIELFGEGNAGHNIEFEGGTADTFMSIIRID
jgi:hypothetical protein